MNVRDNYECELASVHELETSPYLERNHYISNGYISYMGKRIEFITSLNKGRENNIFESVLEIDLSKVDYLTVLDTPKAAKIDLGGNKTIPGMLMTVTDDGNEATLAFFPMSLCCMWSKDPLSEFYDSNYNGWYIFSHRPFFRWKERPFSQIITQFHKGTKIAFTRVSYRPSKCDNPMVQNYIHVW